MKKSFKPVIEQVLEIISTNLEVHTIRFETFTIQKPSDTQVMILTVRLTLTLTYSIGRMQIYSLLGEVCWHSSDTNLLSAEKKSLNMLKTCSIEVLHNLVSTCS